MKIISEIKYLWMASLVIMMIISSYMRTFSQKASDDFFQINNTYLEAHSYTVDIIVNLYENDEDYDPVITYNGCAKKDGDNYYSEMMGKIFMSNKKSIITINTNAKLIIYSKKESSKIDFNTFEMGTLVDSLLKTFKEVKVVSLSGNKITYKLIPEKKSPLYNEIMVSIDTEKEILCNIIYHYTSEFQYKKVSIEYLNTRLNCKISNEIFDEKNYLLKQKEEFIPVEKYSGYKVVIRK